MEEIFWTCNNHMIFTKGFPCESKVIYTTIKACFKSFKDGNSPKRTQCSTLGKYKFARQGMIDLYIRKKKIANNEKEMKDIENHKMNRY